MERLTNILHYTVFALILLIMAVFAALQTPYIQTSLTGKVINTLEKNFDADITLESVHFKPMNTILLKGLYIVDYNPCCEEARDTLLQAGSLTIRFSLSSLLSPLHEDVILKEVQIRDAQFNLVIEGGDWGANLSRMFKLREKEEKSPMREADILTIHNIIAENLSFSMQNFVTGKRTAPANVNAIDWADMGVDNINMKAREFSISHGLFSATVDNLSFRERSGWTVKSMKCTTVTGKGRALISSVDLDDGITRSNFDFSMTGTSEDFKDFVNKVSLDANIRKGSRFSLEMLSRFIPPLAPTPGVYLDVTGHAYGPVCNLTANNIRIRAERSSVDMTVNGKVTGLPDVNAMHINAKVSPLRFTLTDLCRFVNAIVPKANLTSGTMAGTGLFTASVTANGTLRNLDAGLTLNQGEKEQDTCFKLHANNLIGRGRKTFNGSLNAGSLDLKALLGTEKLGSVTASMEFDIALPHNGIPLDARIDSLRIDSFHYNGYTYRDISGEMSLQNTDLTAAIQSRDKAADADITVWSDKYSYNGALIVRKADLYATNFDKRGISTVSFNAYGHLDKDIDNLQGNANVSLITLTNGRGTHEVDDITVSVGKTKGDFDILLESDMAHATFAGNARQFRTELESYDTAPLLAFVMPGLYMENGTHIQIAKDSTEFVSASASSGRIAFGRNYVKDLGIEIWGRTDSLYTTLASSRIQLLGYSLDNNALNAGMKDNLFTFNYAFNNADSDEEKGFGHGSIGLDMVMGQDRSMEFRVRPSGINFNGRNWDIPETAISVKGRELKVDNFLIKSDDHWISIDGETSETEQTTLEAVVHNMDLTDLNEFTDKDMNYRGIVNSTCRLYSPLGVDVPLLETETYAKALGMGSIELGDLTVRSEVDIEQSSFNADITDVLDGRNAIKGNVIFKPYERNVEAGIKFNAFPVGFVQNILPDVFSNVEGSVSGTVGINGPMDNLRLSSSGTRLDNGLLRIAFTDVPYYVEGPFTMSNNGVKMNGMKVTDRLDGSGNIRGGIVWNRFRDAGMDMKIDVKNMKGLAVSSDKAGSVVYGNVFASGNVSLKGPFNALTLSTDIRSTGNSDLHIALSGAAQATKGNLLTFTSPDSRQEDPYLTMLKTMDDRDETAKSDFRIRMHAIADPTMSVSLDLGSGGFAAGLSGRGNGDIDLALGAETAGFSITGNYVLTEGEFDVNASSLVHRKFSISDGSSIKFGGDVMQSTVDLDATYQTKASIEALIADTDAVANRRTVNCGIHMQNRLSNPEIRFSIDIPDLSPSAKSQVDGALNTDDKVQRQFLSLLLSGNFLPDEQSGIVNNNSLLFSNVSEMMANQVNSIFTRLNIPLDLGLNYQPSDDGTRSLFDVALSTQLFNNRVLIGGTFGNRQNMSSSKQTIFGDLDIQYKVLRSGTLRLNLFSHAADKYTNSLDDSQKNGLGITWQQEFDQLPEWIRRLFADKATKEILIRLMAEQARKTKTMILDE